MLPKFTYFEPRPLMVPAVTPVAEAVVSSSMLLDVAPIVLPPSTVPMNDAPGTIDNVLLKPAANATALPLAEPALTSPAL